MINEPSGQTERLDRGLVTTRTDTPTGVFLAMHGEIDCASAPAFLARLRGEIDHCGDPIVLDLAHVTFMDSSGVAALLTAREWAGARLRLGPLHPSVHRVLQLTAVGELLGAADGSAGEDRELEIG